MLVSHNEAETLAIGRAIGALLRPGDVVAIDGPLGAGKTRLVRGIALGLGIDGSAVSSPTFVVVNEYERPCTEPAGHRGAEAAPRRLFHVDAYRLSSAEDLDSLGWDRVRDPSSDAAVAIEWAERLADPSGAPTIAGEETLCRVQMEPSAGAAQTLRRVTIQPPPGWRADAPGWRDLERLAEVLGDPGATGIVPPPRPLPRGWIRCPTTGKPVPPDAPTFPFADERARLADLGRWMSGAYTISREVRDEDEAG